MRIRIQNKLGKMRSRGTHLAKGIWGSPAMYTRTIMIAIVFVAACVATANPPPHEQPPTMPWIRPVREITQSTAEIHAPCASHVTRDGYTSIQVNVDAYGCNIPGDAANEPSIAIDPTDPKKIVIGWRQFDSVLSDFRQAGWAYSHDAGHTWVFKGSPTFGVEGSDPVLAAGPNGEIYYLSINMDEMRFFRSHDGGVSWLPKTIVADGFWDKPWMSVDGTLSPGRGAIYVAAEDYMFQSLDGGNGFLETGSNVGLEPTTTVGPDGTFYVLASNVIYRASVPWDDSIPIDFDLRRHRLNFALSCPSPTVVISPHAQPNPNGSLGQQWIVSDASMPASAYHTYVLIAGPCPGSLDEDVFVERS
ncbi:MAG: exo-alpha-sialidase, partial [Planctomycetes bacterium]|nr:exo-alpha-sialidase [Planctomycetota bacterium]